MRAWIQSAPRICRFRSCDSSALSPEVQKGDAKFIKGASAGDLFNTVTQQVWDGEDGVVVIPWYTVKYLEFGLREAGGGFFGELDANSPDIKNTTRNGTSEILLSVTSLSARHSTSC